MAAANDTFELGLHHVKAGQALIVTHHFRLMAPVAPGSSAGQNLIDSWQTIRTTWLATQGQDTTLGRIRARHICGTVPLDNFVDETLAAVGTVTFTASLSLPPWFAALVRERTALAGRSRQGRFFVPLASEEDFVGDALQTTVLNRINAYNTALMARFGPGGSDAGQWQLVVHSRKLAQPGVQCNVSSTPVAGLSTSSALTTQRSRRQRPVT